MNYSIESYDPQSGRIRVAYSSTEEIVSVYSYDLAPPHGVPPSEQELDQLIRSRAPIWRLTASVSGDTSTSWLTALELGAHAHPIGATQTLDDCKAAKIAQVRKFRDAVLHADITCNGGSYRANLAHANLLAAVVCLENTGPRPNASLQWPNQGNQLVDISVEAAKDMLQAMLEHATRVFQLAAQKEAAIGAAQTEQAVADVAWIEPGIAGGVLPGNFFVMSGPCHQTFETEIAVDRVSVQ